MANPATDYASINLLQVEDDRGNFVEFEDARSLDYDVTKDRRVISTMNRKRRTKGFQSGNLMVSGTIEVPQRRGVPEYDFQQALIEDRVLNFYIERDDGGQRFIVQDIMITSVAPSSNESGEATERIAWTGIEIFKDITQAFAV